ncbi:hypothetical protein L228DRAFT_18840 [Xylona heveae TC161]|uniref:Uncharacterized protein n=1 Tax=Xylona heveae (strain CBS 132557 / TC161) TaxID=1328760 RepID=A0A165JYP5_XYLHT|nr:hypothetical protein L228DRAFT_18840 [Xylona heveae TC161]KZF26794.1 hypothetical protein L228DRAFT_18840 [Xylona heveae TC161]
MDIFDSATVEMKRKRNQKKDGSILEQMKVSSLEVEPTEMVFTPKGSFSKQYLITGSADEDSPLLRLKTLPKKVRQKKKNANEGRKGASPRKVTKKISKKKAKELGQLSQQVLAMLENTQEPTPEVAQPQFTADEMEEFRLTVGNFPPEKDPTFTIFEDGNSEELEQCNSASAPMEFVPTYAGSSLPEYHETEHSTQNHGLSLLNSEFILPQNFHFAPEEMIPFVGHRSQFPALRNTSSRILPSDKENIEPHGSRQANVRYWPNQTFPGKGFQSYDFDAGAIQQYLTQMPAHHTDMEIANVHGFYGQSAAFNFPGTNAQICAHTGWPDKMPQSSDGLTSTTNQHGNAGNIGNLSRTSGCTTRATLAQKKNAVTDNGAANSGYHQLPYSTIPGLQERAVDMNTFNYAAADDNNNDANAMHENGNDLIFSGI